MVAAVLGLSGATEAQTWETEKGQYALRGCYTARDAVLCDLTYTLTKDASLDFLVNPGRVQTFTVDGATNLAEGISFGGGQFYDSNYVPSTRVVQGVPIKITVKLNVPVGTRVLRALLFDGKRLDNVAVSSGNAPAPVAVSTPAPNVGVPSGFQMQLSNCKVSAGTYTCTATLTPTR